MLKRGFKGFLAEVDMVIACASVPDQSHRFEQIDLSFAGVGGSKECDQESETPDFIHVSMRRF